MMHQFISPKFLCVVQDTYRQQTGIRSVNDASSVRDEIEHGGFVFERHLSAVNGLYLQGDTEAANVDVAPDSQEPPLYPRLRK